MKAPKVNTPQRDLRLAAAGGGMASLILYLLTMNRTFGVVDYGELAACAYTLGTPHPTGYPTIIFAGFVWSHALELLGMRPVTALNLLAALLVAASVAAMTYLFHYVVVRFLKDESVRGATGRSSVVYAALAALFTGLTGVWWDQATGFEVYCLHALLMPLVTLLFLRYVDHESGHGTDSKQPGGFTRAGSLFAFVLGMAFTNHVTIGLLAPGFLVYYFWTVRRPLRALARLLYLAPAFLLGLLPPYIWMALRAGGHPRFNWGDPSTLVKLLYHVRGGDYSGAMYHFFDAKFSKQFLYFLNTMRGEVGIGLIAAAAGLAVLARRAPRLAVATALVFVVAALFACSYDVNDIGNYFMGCVLAAGMWCAVALWWTHARFGARPAIAAGIVIVLATGFMNYADNDERQNTITEDYTWNMLTTLPQNAVVFTKGWDFWEAGSYYLQEVENVRRDVTVIDMSLLSSDWYIDQLERYRPGLMAGVQAEAARFRQQAVKFRFGSGTYTGADSSAYSSSFMAMVYAMVDSNIGRYPMFLTYDDVTELSDRYKTTPFQLVRRITPDPAAYLPQQFTPYRFRLWNRHVIPQTVWTSKLYAVACTERAQYEMDRGNADLANRYMQLAVGFDPMFREEDVPDFPVHIERQVIEVLRQFRTLRKQLQSAL